MGFSGLLKPADRRRLREYVKKVHLRYYPSEFLTDYEADKLVDSFSERVIERTLRAARKAGVE
jgi:hypothetical protein